MTFVSTSHAILYNGAEPVFADIDSRTLNINVEDVKRKVTDRTKAIVVVHYGGHPVDLDELRAIAAPRGIPILEDAAHAAGAEYKGRRIGSMSEVTCFSFHAVKNLATGEGGMITVADDGNDARLRRLRWMGITKDTWGRAEDSHKYSWAYDVAELGFKCALSDIPAALGLVQLKKLDRTNARRRDIATRYSQGLSGLTWLETPTELPHVKSSWHNYVIKVPDRDRIMSLLQENDIATGMHYIPNHLYEMYKPWRRELPVTESVWTKLVTLPMYPDLQDHEVDRIIEVVRSLDDQFS